MKKVLRIAGAASIACLLGTLAVACSSAAPEPETAPPANQPESCSAVDLSTPPAEPVQLRIASAIGVEGFAAQFQMDVSPKQYRPNAGVWYELTNIPFADPAQRIPAFQSGQADGFLSSFPQLLTLPGNGIDVSAVAVTGNGTFEAPTEGKIVAAASSGIKSFKDLEGKTIGSLGLGTGGELLIRMQLDVAGVPQDSVKLVNIPAAQQMPSVIAGSVDAATGLQPFLGEALDAGDVVSLGSLYGGLQKLTGITVYENTTLVIGNAFLKEHTEAACAFLLDYRASLGWLENNEAEAKKIFSDAGLIAMPWDQYKDAPSGGIFPTGDAVPNVELFRQLATYAVEFDIAPASIVEVADTIVWPMAIEK